MKTNDPIPRTPPGSRRRTAAFTFVEMMVASALTVFVITGIVYSYVFGMRMYELSRAKMGCTDDARRAINKMVDEIRSATVIRVGDGKLNSFDEVPNGQPQQGNSIMIFPTKNTNDWIRYYHHKGTQQLRRTEDGVNSFVVLANQVTNTLVFSSEEFLGTILTNNFNNRVIGVRLEFASIQYPMMSIGPSNYFDYYQLRTKITRRKLE